LRGPQLAYYLKKRNPELYRKAKEIKERYNVTWDEAFAILRGEKKPPQVAVTGSETHVTLNDVVKRVESIEKRVSEISEVIYFLEWNLDKRFQFDDYRCVYIDDDGYCRVFYLVKPLKGFRLREVVEGDEKRYYINVKEHKWVCALCPRYVPKYITEVLGKLEFRLSYLEAQVKKQQRG